MTETLNALDLTHAEEIIASIPRDREMVLLGESTHGTEEVDTFHFEISSLLLILFSFIVSELQLQRLLSQNEGFLLWCSKQTGQ